jgi:hypothetical protein
MKLISALITAMLLIVPTGGYAGTHASDCEAARCAVQDAINQCPCDSATKNHGQYVSCVAHVRNRLAKDGTIPTNCKGAVQRCAAHSICGKPGFVTCEIPQFGTCGTACSADPTATCCADATTACTADTDCVVGTKCKIKSSADRCAAAGGAVGTSNTCCSDCPTPVPTP